MTQYDLSCRKRPPRLNILGGRLRKVQLYLILEHGVTTRKASFVIILIKFGFLPDKLKRGHTFADEFLFDKTLKRGQAESF